MPHYPPPRAPALSRCRSDTGSGRPDGVPATCRWGADVVQVQMPDHMRGDDTLGGQDGSDYQYTHRNKRSVTLNLKGRGHRRSQASDRDGRCRGRKFSSRRQFRLGIDYEALCKDQPRLVYASISGFGQTGPLAGGPARSDCTRHGWVDVGHGLAGTSPCAWVFRSPICAPVFSRPRVFWSRCWSAKPRAKGNGCTPRSWSRWCT